VDARWAELLEQGHRYQDLHDSGEGIAHKVLTETLRKAERDGLVTRHLDAEHIDTATLYQLTDLGRSLDVPLTTRRSTCSSSSELVHGDLVEVAGIEPASFSTSPGLLRAQPALLFSAPAVMQASRRTGSAAVRCPV